MTLRELDTVVLERDLPTHALRRGDVGAVVAVQSPTAVEVEFVRASRQTQAIVKGDTRTETIPLTCLSSEQAGQLLSPYVRSNGSIYYVAKPPLKIITVRATPAELQTVHELLARFDGPGRPGCAAP